MYRDQWSLWSGASGVSSGDKLNTIKIMNGAVN